MNITETKIFLVIYSTDRMREREFTSESEANDFAATVKGSVCPITKKTYSFNSQSEQRKYNKELKRIRRFGY